MNIRASTGRYQLHYAEGRGVRIPVNSRTDLEGVLKIAGIKAATK